MKTQYTPNKKSPEATRFVRVRLDVKLQESCHDLSAKCGKKVAGTIGAKHPPGRPGKWCLPPSSLGDLPVPLPWHQILGQNRF